MKLIISIIAFSLTDIAYANHHEPVPMGAGAFVAMMVQAPDVDKYITSLKSNNAPVKAIGSSVAGECETVYTAE